MVENLDKWRKAGRIAAQALEYAASLVIVGGSLLEVTEKAEYKIKQLGAKPAFPVQISLNEIAAHYCAKQDDETKFKEGDIVKIDIGVEVEGCIGDNAATIYLGNDEEIKKLVNASKEALAAAIKTSKAGAKVNEIGKAIAQEITKYGFQPIHNLSGHGLDVNNIHTFPNIPNYDNKDETQLEEGMIIAIEPFATNGAGFVKEMTDAEVVQQIQRKPVRSLFAREILKEIQPLNGLPFCMRWLYKKHHKGKVDFALREMDKLDMIRLYPPLPDSQNGLVTQFEHTLLITKEGCEILTKI